MSTPMIMTMGFFLVPVVALNLVVVIHVALHPGVTFVGCHYQAALLQPHSHLNSSKNNLEVNLSKQSVKDQN